MKQLQKICVSILITVVLLVNMIPVSNAIDSKLEAAVQWAINIANDNSHGYKWGGHGPIDYDCSGLVIEALRNAGFDVGSATYTGNMKSQLTARNFTWIPWSNIGGVWNLQRGDILLRHPNSAHTEFYIGNNQIVGANSDRGYPQSGDQTGTEIYIKEHGNRTWDGVLRYNGGSSNPAPGITYSGINEGDYYIVNKGSGKYLNAFADAGRATRNTNICASNQDNSAEQKFKIQSAGDKKYYIRSLSNGNQWCVNAESGSYVANNANVMLWDYNNVSSKMWYFESVDGAYVIHNAMNPSLVLAAVNYNARANVVVQSYTGSDLQKWYVNPLKQPHTHSYSSSVTTQPTCTANGTKTFTCSCGHSYTESIAALGHNPTKTAAKSATCTEKGYTEGSKCSRCGTVLTAAKEIAPLGHSPVETAAKSATCTEKGYTAGSKCSRCDAVITAQKEIAPLGHDWPEQFNIDKKPTVDENGQKSRKCKRCGAVDTQSVDKSEVPEVNETAQINILSSDFTYDDNTGKYFITYTIKLVSNPGLSQITLNVVYDMNTYTMYFDNAGIFDSAGAYTDVQNGEENAFDVVMIYNDDNENITSTGDILTITFYTDNGYFYSGDINFSVEAGCTDYNSIYTNSIFNAVDVVTLNSAVVIPVACVAPKTETDAVVHGDINGDGKTNNKDLTRLLRYLSGEEIYVNEAVLDVNNDGKVNNKDLTRLLRYLSGENVEIK